MQANNGIAVCTRATDSYTAAPAAAAASDPAINDLLSER
jgi:hypothetical protein